MGFGPFFFFGYSEFGLLEKEKIFLITTNKQRERRERELCSVYSERKERERD